MNAPGNTTNHPLYADYRRAVLNRNDEEAVKVLQNLVRLNPADANAAAELERLDARVLAARLEHLAGSLAEAEPALLTAEIEAIEAFGFKNQPEGEVWRKAQATRCEVLLEETARLKEGSRWQEALAKIDLVHRLQTDLKLQLPAAVTARLGALEAWAQGEWEQDKKNRQFQALLGELQLRISKSEEKDTSARYVELPELRDDFEGIHKVWRSLTDFARPIPEEAAAGFRKRSGLLEAEIGRRTALRRRLIVTGAALVFGVGALIVWLALGHMKASAFNHELEQAVAQRQVHTAEKLLERAHTEKIGSAEAIADAETFAAKERALLANFEAACNQLPPQLTGEPEASRLAGIADQLALAQKALAALAPDLKTENEPRLLAFRKQWEIHLSESSAKVNGLLAQWVGAAEQKCGELDYSTPVEKAAAQIAALASLVQKIDDTTTGFTNRLELRSDLLQRVAAVRARFTAYAGELRKLDDGMTALRNAHTTRDFSEGISLMASSEFSASPAATAASVVQTLNASEETALRSLLGATSASTWAFLGKPHPTLLVPEVVMPAERQIFQQLNDDPAVGAIHQRYRLSLDAQGNNSVEWIIAGPAFEPVTGWRKIKAWTVAPAAKTAKFNERDYGYFNGQYKLSPTQPVYRLEPVEHPDETAVYRSVGLEQAWSGHDSYSKPLLEVLDTLKESTNGSALFRAYLCLRLMDVMRCQPDAWGLPFCPSAQTIETQIKGIVGDEFSSGDWFVPEKTRACSGKLEQLFDSVKMVSCAKQAVGSFKLAQAISKVRLKYVGFVGLDGQANYIDKSMAGEVYGYSAAAKRPVLLATRIETDQPLKNQAMPLSPLFALETPRQQYLSQAGVDPADTSFRDALPPLFQP